MPKSAKMFALIFPALLVFSNAPSEAQNRSGVPGAGGRSMPARVSAPAPQRSVSAPRPAAAPSRSYSAPRPAAAPARSYTPPRASTPTRNYNVSRPSPTRNYSTSVPTNVSPGVRANSSTYRAPLVRQTVPTPNRASNSQYRVNQPSVTSMPAVSPSARPTGVGGVSLVPVLGIRGASIQPQQEFPLPATIRTPTRVERMSSQPQPPPQTEC